MPVTAVIFDLDDTLIVEEAVARSSLRATAQLMPDLDPVHIEDTVLATARRVWHSGPYRQLCLDLGIASWEGLWATFERGHPVVDGLRDWAPLYRREAWSSALAELGVVDPSLAAAMSDAFVETQRQGHPLIPGAAEAVRSLAGQCRLGLLTNGPGDIQRLKIQSTGLVGYFDAVVISGEVGVGKPHPTAFRKALDRLGAAANETVMVGDSWERDVLGALGVGMPAVWLAHGRPPPEDLSDVTVVDGISDVAAVTV